MKNNLTSHRSDYNKGFMNKSNLLPDPNKQLEVWINEAIKMKVNEPTAMVLSTIGEDEFPQSRIVLLKSTKNGLLSFFTNYKSDKGKAIEFNSNVSLLFFWPELERQIRVRGTATKSTEEISDSYFSSRPFESQISAIVSNQSSQIESREILDERFNVLLNSKQPVSRPENWGGYHVAPIKFEFWQGRPNRLNDRLSYKQKNGKWKIVRLQP